MTDRLAPQAWLAHPATIAVMDALEAAGGAGAARFVGGCVRNALLGRAVDDIDIATVLAPGAVVRALSAAGLKAIPTGLTHGTVTALAAGRPFEITTLRRDVETDGRHAVVAFTDDWRQDAERRDFTLNALYADRTGRLFDPTGVGIADARAGAIVFVGDPAERIAEDALRIPRFFRFLAWYGRGAPNAAAVAACRNGAPAVAGLSAERVSAELLKLLAADDPRAAVRLMAQTGVLGRLLPRTAGLARFEALVGIETGQLFSCDPLLRLGALLVDDPGAVEAEARRLRLSNAQRGRLVAAATGEPLVSWMSPREVRRALWRSTPETLRDRVLLAWAASERPAAATQWRALLPMTQSWPRPVLPLTGDEVVAAGVPAGPLVGAVLREVEAWWVDNDFTGDKLSVIERLKAVAQGMIY